LFYSFPPTSEQPKVHHAQIRFFISRWLHGLAFSNGQHAMPSAPGSKNGAAFLKHIKNSGKVADQLVSVRTTIANKAEIHEMKMDGDVMKMRAINGIDIPPGAEVSVAKGNAKGFHLMLLGLKKPLKDGDKFAMWLTFKNAGEVQVEVWVQSPVDAEKPEKSQDHKH
jgi:periplasmic copper chaperone A